MFFVFLSETFYDHHNNCPEIEQKPTRPYLRLCITVNNTTFAVPFRSHIHHKHAYLTDPENSAGLDFSKSVVISRPDYIDPSRRPQIRQHEFDAIKGKERLIEQKLIQYIHTYKKAKQRPDIPRNQTILKYSTLQYFERYLRGI